MKWNIIIGTLVLGFGMVSQSFGYDLLDRMLGSKGCGCEAKTSCCDTKSGKNGSCQKNGSKDGSKNGACQKSRGGLFGSRCGCDKGGKGDCSSKNGASQKNGSKDGSKNGACQKSRGGLFGSHGCGCDDGKGSKNGASQKNGSKDGSKNGACQKSRGGLFGSHGCGCDDGKGSKDGACQKGGKSSCDRGSLFDRIFACNRCCDSKGGKGGKGDDNGKSCGCDDGKGASQKAGPVSADPPAPIVDPSAYLPSRRVVPVSTTVIR